jgi:hypothetical protein
MNPYRTLIMWTALAALLLASLACGLSDFGLGPAPAASPSGPPDFYTATDKAGQNQTTSFSKSDAVYLLIDTRGLPPGVVFDLKWYGLDVIGMGPNTPFAFHTISHDGISPTEVGWVGGTQGLPAGHYRVDVFENGARIGEALFSVQ